MGTEEEFKQKKNEVLFKYEEDDRVPGAKVECAQTIDRETALKDFKQHACQAAVYVKTPTKINKALLLMELRNDGYLGWIGGFRREKESLEQCLIREFEAETGVRVEFAPEHYLKGYDRGNFCTHIYAKEVTQEQFTAIETRTQKLASKDEVLGFVRVPLYTYNKPNDPRKKSKGFPVFLRNQFFGCSLQQLLDFVVEKGYQSRDEVLAAATLADVEQLVPHLAEDQDKEENKDSEVAGPTPALV